MRDTGPRTFKSRAASWSAAGKWVGLCARGLKKRRNNKVVKKEQYNVAVVGATGAVGEQMREVLAERAFPVGELRLLASERSAGQALEFQGKHIRVELLEEDSFENIDIALFSAGGSVSDKFAPIAVAAGAVVVDNTA